MVDSSLVRIDALGTPCRILFILDSAKPTTDIVEELQEWADFTQAVENSRISSNDILSFEGLAVAASSGIIGNAAWSIFPAAARWLTSRGHEKEPANAAEALAAARLCLDLIEPGSGERLRVDHLELQPDGSWHLIGKAKKTQYHLEIDTSGRVVKVTGHAGS